MPHGVHNNPFLGWNPPAEDSAWARAEAARRKVALSTILTEALQEYRAARSAKHPPRPAAAIAAEVEQPPAAPRKRGSTTARKPQDPPPAKSREAESASDMAAAIFRRRNADSGQ